MHKVKTVTAKMIREMIERQNYRCALSGRTLTPETASLDHIHPLGRGGAHSPDNVWIVDQQVNTAKGVLTPVEFLQMCQDVVGAQRQAAAA